MARIRVGGECAALERAGGRDVPVCLKPFGLSGYGVREGGSAVPDVRDGCQVILRDKVRLLSGTVLGAGYFTVGGSMSDGCLIGADGSCMSIFDCVTARSGIVPSKGTHFSDCPVTGCSFAVTDFSCNVTRRGFKACGFKPSRDCEGLDMRNAAAGSFGGCGL